MSRSRLSKLSPRGRLAVLGSVAILAAGGALALAGTASASSTAAPSSSSCRDATLHGTYSYGYEGWTVAKSGNSPTSTAGFDHFNGAGSSTGVTTFVANGVVENNNTPDTSTYTLNADCSGTITFDIGGSLAHFNIYVSPSGNSFSVIETDPGTVQSGIETRVS
ncbi:MAG: hypothetical protein ABSA53_28490 [Streptosporangiaceae bacterium]